MLIEFRVSNYRSFKDVQALSMVAGAGKELPDNTFPIKNDPKTHLLNTSVIYGANASGKSNLIRAIFTFKQIVLYSANQNQQHDKIPVSSYLFNKKTSNQPSKFEIIFIKDGVKYQYGFEADQYRIYEEWLFAYPKGYKQNWFCRTYNKKSNKYDWIYSRSFTGKKIIWEESTRDNSLYLSTAVQLNSTLLKPLYLWFKEDLIIINSKSRRLSSIKTLETLKKDKEKILKYVNIGDPKVKDIIEKKYKKEVLDDILKNSPDYLKQNFNERYRKIEFIHQGGIHLDINDQSHGTRTLFRYAGLWIDALENGKTMFVDELESSLHHLILIFLIRLFYDNDHNKNNSQLIFTTHDVPLLSEKNLFRRDQIWFIEKDTDNSSQLYSLIDFRPRKNESIGHGYLKGKYGAIPHIRDWGYE